MNAQEDQSYPRDGDVVPAASRKRKAAGDDVETGTSHDASAATASSTADSNNTKGRRLNNLLTKLFGPDHATTGLEIRPSPSDPQNYGVYATQYHPPNTVIGGNIPSSALLDPLVVLRHHPLARRAVELAGATSSFAFWLALASMAMELDDAGKITVEKFASYDEYLWSLPRESPEPCSWSEEERNMLSGTQLAKQVEGQLRLLREEYDRVAAELKEQETSNGDDATAAFLQLPPFDLDGRGVMPSLLWARGCHISRSFPRSLVDAANVDMDDAKKDNGSDNGDDETTLLKVQLGGWSVPKITYSGPVESAPSPDDSTTDGLSQGNNATTPPDPTKIAGTLGVMFPFYDMLDHQAGHSITWEAGNGTIRFRCVDEIKAGEQIYNNYGPKGNQELLFTYGFAIEDNPLDSVDGIVFGCRCPEGGDEEAIRLHEARMELLREHDVPHKVENGALLMGPFALFARLPTTSTEDREGDEQHDVEEGEGESVMPQELLFALSVLGMEDAEEGPGLSPYEIDMLRQQFVARIHAMQLDDKEEGDAKDADTFGRAGFVRAYKRGQIQLLQSAIADLDAMVCGEEYEEDQARADR